MNRNTQSGAIGTFVVVGVVLVLAALAVLYGVRQFTISQRVSPVPTDIALPSDNNSTEVADNSQQSQQDKKQQEDKKSETSETAQTDQKTGDAEEKKTDTKPESQTKAETITPSSTTPGDTPSSESSHSNLPTTGPADSMAAIILLGGTTGIATAYVRSRRLV